MTTKVDTLVDRYLTDLAAELRDLPANRRRELLDEVSQHIAEARATLDADNEAAIRTVLERLGDPADIAAEARERVAIPAAPAKPAPRLEVIALVALVIPFLGWVVGVVLVWLSRLWTTRDKLIGTLGGLSWVVAGLGTLSISTRGSTAVGSGAPGPPGGASPLEVVLFVVPFLLPIAAAFYLGFRLRTHAHTAQAAG
jgi:HAAS